MDNEQDSGLHFLDYWRVVRSRKEIVLAVVLLIAITGAGITLMLPKIYMANTTIAVREDSLDVEVFDMPRYSAAYNPFFLKTQFEVIQSRPILYEVIRNKNLQQRWSERYGSDGAQMRVEDVVELLENCIRVEQFRDTSLIEIQVFREGEEGRNEAALIANEIAGVYRNYRLDLKHREVKRAVDALENELRKQQDKVASAEDNLEEIRSDLGVSLLSHGIRANDVSIQQMAADMSAARVDMLTRKARWDQLSALTGDELMNASAYMVNDPSLVNLRRNLVDTEVELKLLLENLGENHPEVRRLQAGVEELTGKLEKALDGLKAGVRADYEVARARFDALDAELKNIRKADISSQRDKYLPFDRAERNLMLQQEILTALRARIAQEGINLEIPRTPVEIISPAETPLDPVKPNILLNMILSIIVGIGAGIGLAFFIEYLDTSVKTVDDVERYLGLPVVGVIPQKVRSLLEEGPESTHAEAYRVLRTNVLFSNREKRGRAFSVASGGVGEGKSTTLFNLAYVCAQLGDRVLLVDSDLRRPVQHTFLGMPHKVGLTNVLMRDKQLSEVIIPSSVPNLDFLPSGKLPRTAVGVLDAARIKDVVEEAKKEYDFIFFDSPPIVGVSDASIIASEMDGVLLIVQYRKYPRHMSTRAKRMLENVGSELLGVVLNNINIFRDDYYYYYHSYYSPTGDADGEFSEDDASLALEDSQKKREEVL